jgi:hypothetical protein
MKTRTQLSLLAAGLSLSLAASAFALPVPDGKAAIAEAVIGKVRYDEGQGLKPLQVGDALAPGATIQTGSNGRATLTLAQDAIMRVAPNTEMTLKDEKVRQGTFLELTRGFARFLVGKRSPGYAFEVQTQNAVAAVKGTDWSDDAGDGKGPTKAAVYASANPVALLLQSSDGGKSTGLAPGESVSFDGTEFKVSKLSDVDRAKVEEIFKALPPVKHDDSEKTGGDTTGSTGGTTGPATGGTTGGTSTDTGMSDADKDALKAELKEITDKAIAEASHDLYVDGFLLKDTKSGDIQAGKIIFDRFGDRVQVSHYITRVDAPVVVTGLQTTIMIQSFSQRDTGPNKGISTATETSTFNTVLPQDWGSVFSKAFDDPSNLDVNGMPIYYRTNESFVAQNPSLDSVTMATTYDTPVFLFNADGPNRLFMGRDVFLTVATVGSGVMPSAISVGFGQTQSFEYAIHAVNPDVNGVYDTNPLIETGHWANVATPYQGGWRFQLTDLDADPTSSLPPILTQDMHLINDDGSVVSNPTFTGSPALPSAFKGFDTNVEMALGSSIFDGRTIDIVFLPGFYDMYDMMNLPTDTNLPPAP